MAKRDPSRPDPVVLEKGGKTLAAAFARWPPAGEGHRAPGLGASLQLPTLDAWFRKARAIL